MIATATRSTKTASGPNLAQTAAFATAALLCFAANSVLCRVALRDGAIDPASFSSIRIVSGAVMLLLIASWTRGAAREMPTSWMSAVMLFLYAVPFSFAYTQLTTGTGALILFGAVQITMLAAAAWLGERLRTMQWLGVVAALAGLVYLVSPGLTAPPLFAATLMGMAGFSWGIYSLRGRGLANPLAQTTTNFTRATPMVLVISLVALSEVHAELRGIVFAIASGAVASGLGYVAWYAALRGLTATRAAVLQLSVPVLAATGGVMFLTEPISLRLVISAMLVLGGIALTLAGQK
jgi:drug/metabolite transporter (DMT)-like permease